MKFTKETARRALRTFLQAFLPALAVGFADADGSFTRGAIIALVIPAVSAGIAAVMNLEEVNSDDIQGVG